MSGTVVREVKDLKYKPLVEAMLELRWGTTVQPAESSTVPVAVDPFYRFILGPFFERLKPDYPVYEPLPTAQVPDEMVLNIAQHRFRAGPGGWPVVQLGPHVMTFNETAGYTWDSFQPRCESVVKRFLESYPSPEQLKVQSVTLRYIDAVGLDPTKQNALASLREMLGVQLALPDGLFENGNVAPSPSSFRVNVSFASTKPVGQVTLQLSTGVVSQVPSLVWETIVSSSREHVPELKEGFSQWLNDAHEITHQWFFKLIAGDLLRRFAGE
jgi:uncharacterized protein (TIGR04255 family)